MQEQKESFVFYRSFFEAIKNLPQENQLHVYNAIAQFALDGTEQELSGIEKAIFVLIRPQIEANNQRYENGKRGGRPPKKNQIETKPEPKKNQIETKPEPNVNVNDNVNVNVNVNDIEPKGSSPKRPQAVTFGYETDAKIHGVTDDLMEYWKLQCPAVNIEQEIKKAEIWLDGNRKKRKHDIKRFLTSWFIRAQDSASRQPTPRSIAQDPSVSWRGKSVDQMSRAEFEWYRKNRATSEEQADFDDGINF